MYVAHRAVSLCCLSLVVIAVGVIHNVHVASLSARVTTITMIMFAFA